MAVVTTAVQPGGGSALLKNRWFILLFSVISMVAVANLQYGWTLFVTPLSKQLGQDATLIRSPSLSSSCWRPGLCRSKASW